MAVTYGEAGESTHNASLRPVVALMDSTPARLVRGTPIESREGIGELLRSWAVLVDLLALGPAPQMTECPVCKHRGLRAATSCGFCRTALVPIAQTGTGQAATRRLEGGKG